MTAFLLKSAPWAALTSLALGGGLACSAGSKITPDDDSGISIPQIGSGGGPLSEDCDTTVELIVRDFNSKHLDMERVNIGDDNVGCGIVASELFLSSNGARTPLYQDPIGAKRRSIVDGRVVCSPWDYDPTPEFTGENYFNEWFSDVAGTNMTFMVVLDLDKVDHADGSTTYVFDSLNEPDGGFFPADGKGFNELTEPGPHNFHFTTEAHVRFGYFGGEKFTFSGDDDMWIFVNNKLALDLGGQHSRLTATIDFDAQAEQLGIKPGKPYNMDIFHAERHTDQSNFRIETNIDCFETVDVPTEVIR